MLLRGTSDGCAPRSEDDNGASSRSKLCGKSCGSVSQDDDGTSMASRVAAARRACCCSRADTCASAACARPPCVRLLSCREALFRLEIKIF